MATERNTQDVDAQTEELIGLVYEGPLEARPWQSALPLLQKLTDAQVVSLILRPPAEGDKGVILNCLRPDTDTSDREAPIGDPSDWELTAYREQFFALDPFVNLPLDTVVTLQDLLPGDALTGSEYYQHYLEPTGLFHILGLDTEEPKGMLARLRLSRRCDEYNSGADERALIERIAPHLNRAIRLYARLSRTTSERDLYSGAVDQLAVATIILDEKGRMLNTNAVARAMLTEADGLSLRDNRLHIDGRDINRELQEALTTIIDAHQRDESSVVRALRVPRSSGRSDLGLVIRPIPGSEWNEGQSSPCAVVFISDPDLRESASQATLSELFGLTPAEANLAILLSRGLSLAEASETQNISQHTARAQLKSIFSKTDVSRQAELVRLILKSVASLG